MTILLSTGFALRSMLCAVALLVCAPLPLHAQSQPGAVPPGGVSTGELVVGGSTWNFDADVAIGSGPWSSVTVTNTNCDTPYRPGTAQAGAIIFTAALQTSPSQTGLTIYTGELLPFTGTSASGHVRVLVPAEAEPTTHVDATVFALDSFALDNTFAVCLTPIDVSAAATTPSGTRAPVSPLAFASGACGAGVPESTAWYAAIQDIPGGQLNGGMYPVRTLSLDQGRGWLEVYAAEVATGEQGFVWVDSTQAPVRLDPSCVYASGLGAQAATDPDEAGPPGPTQDIAIPYGGCLVQQVPPGAMASWSVQEAQSVPLDLSQYIVARATRVNQTNWLGIYGGPQGQVVWLPTNEFIAPDGSNQLRLTASCLVVPDALDATA